MEKLKWRLLKMKLLLQLQQYLLDITAEQMPHFI
jgi:hypothetical protein